MAVTRQPASPANAFAAASASGPPNARSLSIRAARMKALRDFAPLAMAAASRRRVVSRNRVNGKTCCDLHPASLDTNLG